MISTTASTTYPFSLRRLFTVCGVCGISLLGSGAMAMAQSAPQELSIPETAPVVVETAPAAPLDPPAAPAQPDLVEPVVPPGESFVPPAPPAAASPTDTYDAPSSIVLFERSTGCRASVASDQVVSGSPCAIAAPPPVAPPDAAAAGSGPANSISLAAASVRSLSLGSLGTTPSVRDYYRRTLRPPGRLGNGNIRLIFPLSIPAAISSAFGWRVHPISGDSRLHSGTDLAAPMGTPVLAAYAGRVAIADLLGGYGLTVALDHNKATQQTLYAHLSEIFVKPGEWVEQGMVIGRVGSTGLSTGPHLHFEFRQLTPDGWVAMDAGAQLEYALAELVKSLRTAQNRQSGQGGG